jgi:hypothetical protein
MALDLQETPTKQEVQLLYTPDEITEDIDTKQNIASFDYYEGIRYAELLGLKQTTSFNDVSAGTHFIVCCGDVMIKVNKTDYPNIERREI